jgi:hypothetical protein
MFAVADDALKAITLPETCAELPLVYAERQDDI